MKNMARRQPRAQREQMYLYGDTLRLWNIKSLFLHGEVCGAVRLT